MAVQGVQPFIEAYDSNGDPISGAALHVYEAGTTTDRAIYSDASLSTPLANPLTSDAAGRFARFYMASGTYKLRAEVTNGGTLLWQHDNLDTGLSAGAGALPIASGGTGATTAAAARAALDVPSNSELTDLADDISVLTASIQAIIGQPQGRLTMTSATPVLASGVTAGTSLYYTPYTGAQVPIYDGVIFNIEAFAELTLSLHANHTANSIYDVFVWDEGGTLTIGTGPGWNTVTAGAGARGTGAGTTELTRVSGILLNANSMTTRNGSTTYTVAAQRATYLGSIAMDGTNGQLTCHTAYGQSRKFGVWNAFNRRPIIIQIGDAGGDWTYSSATVRQSNGAAGNTGQVLCGLAEEFAKARFSQNVSSNTNGEAARIGIGLNVTNAYTAMVGKKYMPSGATSGLQTVNVDYILTPTIGINNLNCLESYTAGSGTANFGSGADDMLMTIEWWG